MEPALLADPSSLTPQGRTDELVKAVTEDDVLFTLLILSYSRNNEVGGRSSYSGQTPLEAALTAPLRCIDVRRLLVEILLGHGADAAPVLSRPPKSTPQVLQETVEGWEQGGDRQAVAAYRLRVNMTLEEAEEYINEHGMNPDDLPPPVAARSPSPPRASSSRHEPSPSSSRHRPDCSRSPRNSARRSRSPRRRESTSHRPSATEPSSSKRRRSPSPQRRRRSSPSPRQRHSTSPNRRTSISSAKNEPPAPRRSPPASAHLKRPRHGFGDFASHWLFVRGVPITRSERFLQEKVERRGIEVADVFLTVGKDDGNPHRFAYLGMFSARDMKDAIRTLDGLPVDGKRLKAVEFVDKATGSGVPRMADSHPERRYVGAQEQAKRPPDPRRLGLFLLHVHPQVTEKDIVDFLRRSAPSSHIGNVIIRYKGAGTIAFVQLDGGYEDAVAVGKRAILELDGELLLGQAVRVAWRELDPEWLAEHFGERSAQTLPGQVSFSADLGARFIDANAVPLTNNRYNQLASTAQPQEPASAQPPAIPQATHEPSSLAPSSLSPAFASPHPPSPPHHIDALALLSSLGVPPGDLTALSSIWDTHSEGIASGGGRRTTATVNFGFLGQDEARKALAAIQSGEYPYKDDPVQQRRYEVFLEGQAGVSRDWYSIFLAQLQSFSASSQEFSRAGVNAAGSQQVERREEESGGEKVAKEEQH